MVICPKCSAWYIIEKLTGDVHHVAKGTTDKAAVMVILEEAITKVDDLDEFIIEDRSIGSEGERARNERAEWAESLRQRMRKALGE